MYQPSYNDRKGSNRQFQEAATQRKAANDTQFFWDLVARHNSGHLVGGRKPSKAQEEHFLFHKKSEETSSGLIDDSIPVQRSGPKADEISALESFEDLKDVVPPSVIRCVEILKFDRPTPIQKHAVPLGLSGLDLMCCAQTGSGKTLAFLVPVVTAIHNRKGDEAPQVIDSRGVLPKAIILAPTRELASQIHLDARRLTFGSMLRSVCVYGGNDIRNQLVELCVGADLIVATPGRLNDLVDRGIVSLCDVSFLILDEADRMLDMGFEPQIRKIVQESDMPTSENRQTFMFSATFPPEIQTLAREFLRNYVWIAVGRVGSTVDNIKQHILLSSPDPQEKIRLLMSVLEETDGRTLVFVQKRKTASWLCETLRGMFGIAAEEIHGDRSQAQRESALKAFRDGNIRILVATDVAARGLDVPAVTHVVQFDMPLSPEDFDVYVHRIGRTGRAGMSGLATSFFVPGREVGEGNGKIASLLVRILRENNQEVPEWLAALEDAPGGGYHGGHNTARRGPNHFNSNFSQQRQQAKFGYSDQRNNQQNVMYGVSGSYYQRNGHQTADPYNQAAPSSSRPSFSRPQTMSSNTMPGRPMTNNNYSPQMSQGYYQQYQQPYPTSNLPSMNTANMYATQPSMMQAGYPQNGYYDPYMTAYMSSQGGNANGIDSQTGYSQTVSLQQQWMVANNPSQVMPQQVMSTPETERSQPMNNYSSRDYNANNGRQYGGRQQNRTYQNYAENGLSQERGYNQHGARQYSNSNYGYNQGRNGEYGRPRDGNNYYNQHSRYSQYGYENYSTNQNLENEEPVESVEIDQNPNPGTEEEINYSNSDPNESQTIDH